MQNSAIEWTDHTFNPVWGCVKVSPGCQHCYAETLAHRYKHNVWGPAKTTPRREMSANYWRQPYRWEKAAKESGKRARVFCGSMCDVFEDHRTNEWARANLFGLIEETQHLDWLLLTKRPENIRHMVPAAWLREPPYNVWYGTSCENQEWFDKRIDALLDAPARVHFLSCEPLLGPIDTRRYRPSWIIAGGESGPKARPCWPEWVHGLRSQCEAKRIPFHFKQWGEYEPYEEDAQPPFWNDQHGRMYDGHGLNILNPETSEVNPGWHEDSIHSPYAFRRVGKHAAGRLLDGREWNELPLSVDPARIQAAVDAHAAEIRELE